MYLVTAKRAHRTAVDLRIRLGATAPHPLSPSPHRGNRLCRSARERIGIPRSNFTPLQSIMPRAATTIGGRADIRGQVKQKSSTWHMDDFRPPRSHSAVRVGRRLSELTPQTYRANDSQNRQLWRI